MMDLGTLPGGVTSFAYGINQSGQVVGYSTCTASPYYGHAFLYSGGTMTDLGTLPGTLFSQGLDINNSGQVVGYSSPMPYNVGHAWLYSDGTMTDLGTLPGGSVSVAGDINDSGQVVGTSETNGFYEHAFLYSNGTMTDLGTLPGGSSSGACGINSSGQIVGASDSGSSGGFTHAFLYSNGTMTDLGFAGMAVSINDSGQIVGWANCGGFLYTDGVMYDLNDLIDPSCGWRIIEAEGINNAGQITGDMVNQQGYQHAFLLTPGTLPPPKIGAEPGTMALIVPAILGFAGIAFRRMRK
jgi:probable HAF family extracellular repeat protein